MATLACDACAASLPVELSGVEGFAPCPGCGAPLLVEVFPAFHRALPPGEAGDDVEAPGEATCFTHPRKRAAGTCERCGAFVCKLCDLPVAGEHLCPRCLDLGVKRRKIPGLERERLLHGRIALSLAVLPLLVFYFTLLTAPAAIFVAIRYWNAPRSLVRPTRTGHVVAIVLSVLQLVGWAFVVVFVVRALTEGRGS